MSRFEKYEFITDLIALSVVGALTGYAVSNVQNHDLQWALCALMGICGFFYATSVVKARHK